MNLQNRGRPRWIAPCRATVKGEGLAAGLQVDLHRLRRLANGHDQRTDCWKILDDPGRSMRAAGVERESTDLHLITGATNVDVRRTSHLDQRLRKQLARDH